MSDTRKYNKNVTLPMGSMMPKLPSEKVTRPMSEILQVAAGAATHRSEPVPRTRRKGDAFSEAKTVPLARERTLAAEARALFERNFGVRLDPDLGPPPRPAPVELDEAPEGVGRVGQVAWATAILAATVVLLALVLQTVVPASW